MAETQISQHYGYKSSSLEDTVKINQYEDDPVLIIRNIEADLDECSVPNSEKQFVYFLKAHKTGSTTMRNILQRFALQRNLTIPIFKTHHPYPSRNLTNYLRPILTYHRVYQYMLKTGKRNLNARQMHYLRNLPLEIKTRDSRCHILDVHTVFVKEQAMQLFPSGATFISTLRHPLEQTISSFGHWNLAKILQIANATDPADAVEKFLHNPARYDKLLPASLYNVIAKLENLRLSFTKNYIAYEFGFDLDLVRWDVVYVNNYLEELNNTFKVIIFTHRFTESLILLKRQMCWSFQDILFIHLRNNRLINRSKTFSDELLETHKKWTPIDYKIYNMFLSRHENLIKQAGDMYQQELRIYEDILHKVKRFCMAFIFPLSKIDDVTKDDIKSMTLYIQQTEFNEDFTITGANCILMSIDEDVMWMANKVQKYPQLCDTGFYRFVSKGLDVNLGPLHDFCGDDNIKYNIPSSYIKQAFWKV